MSPSRSRSQCHRTLTAAGSESTVDQMPPFVWPPEPAVRRAAAPPPPSRMHADLARLLETKEGTDVDFEVRGRLFTAHKIVLAARSTPFKKDLFGATKEKTTTGYVRISDMHPDAFEALLHYIYTESLPATMANKVREEGAAVLGQDLLLAADRYKLKDLKPLAETALCDHVGLSSVLPMLAVAEHHGCQKLKRKCLEFMASGKNTRKIVMEADDVESLARSCPSVVKEVIVKILDAREATPSNPVVVSVDSGTILLFCMIFIVFFSFIGLFIYVGLKL